MGYKPRVWKAKEPITAPKLNDIENAINEINLKINDINENINNKGDFMMHIASVEITPNSNINKSDITVKTEIQVGDLVCDINNNIYKVISVQEDIVRVSEKMIISEASSDIIADMELTAITDLSGDLKGLSGMYKSNKEDAVSHKISFTITRE